MNSATKKSLDFPRMPRSHCTSLFVHVMFAMASSAFGSSRDQGNPACWSGTFSYDYCCSSRHGAEGNSECWDGHYSFSHCCHEPLHSAAPSECWQEARERLQNSEDPLAKHPSLVNPANLAVFCCHASHLSSEACWGSKDPGGSPILLDASTGEPLGFTRRHVECCFPELQRLAKDAPAEWMAKQLDHDFLKWEGQEPIRGSDMDAFEAAMEVAGRGAELCRFRLRKTGIYHCDFNRSRYVSLLHAVRAALQILHIMFGLPELDLFIHTGECLGIDVAAKPHAKLTVPVLAQAQLEGSSGILMPWWAFLQIDWTRRLRERLQQASSKLAWQERRDVLFWRGSDTGCLMGGLDNSTECALWSASTWPLFPRSKLVLTSSLFPSRVDALFTKDTVHKECEDVYDSSGLRIEEIVPPEVHVRYKYLAYIDGTSFSDRLYWLLLTDSVVFRSSSRIRVWLDQGLQAWKHYIPVLGNLADLMDQLEWAKENDRQSAEIAAAASAFAKNYLTLEGSLFYLYQVLLRLSGIVEMSPDELLHDPPEVAAQSTFPDEIAFDCWALGFTPEFCCNEDQFGPGGNTACWDGPYTFEACCGGFSTGSGFKR